MVETVDSRLSILPVMQSVAILFKEVSQWLSALEDTALQADKSFTKLCRAFEVQSTIFENQELILLAYSAGRDIATDMTRDISHPAWSDPLLDQTVMNALRTSCELHVRSLRMIEDKLSEINRSRSALEEKVHLDHSNLQSGFPRLRALLRRTLKRPRPTSIGLPIEDKVDSLRELVLGFTQSWSPERLQSSRQTQPMHSHGLDHMRQIRHDAMRLYDCLESEVPRQTHHRAQMSLQPYLSTSTTRVRFHIGLRSGDLGFNHLTPHVWVWVDSVAANAITSNTSGSRSDSLKENPLDWAGLSTPLAQLAGGLQTQGSHLANPTPADVFEKHRSVQDILFGLPAKQMFPPAPGYRQKNRQAQTDKYLGRLESPGSKVFLIYLGAESSASSTEQGMSTLRPFTDLLLQGSNLDNARGLTTYERLRLARILAIALLNFHTTPWLGSSWRSQNIYFSGKPSKVAELFLDVPIPRSEQNDLPKQPFARNPILFRFGVTLLEIAFQAPFERMKRKGDEPHFQDDQQAEYETALRLSKTASTLLGAKYSELTRKCLFCDFGYGTDLSNPELEGAFYSEVVVELETLETGLFALQLNRRIAKPDGPERDSRLGVISAHPNVPPTAEVVSHEDGSPVTLSLAIFVAKDTENLTMRSCVLDTGSPVNLIDERALRGLEYEVRPYRGRKLAGLGSFAVLPKGTVNLRFKFRGTETIYEAEYLVLSKNLNAGFDVLVGWPWLRNNGFVENTPGFHGGGLDGARAQTSLIPARHGTSWHRTPVEPAVTPRSNRLNWHESK